MFNRVEFKNKAHKIVAGNYLYCIIVGVIGLFLNTDIKASYNFNPSGSYTPEMWLHGIQVDGFGLFTALVGVFQFIGWSVLIVLVFAVSLAVACFLLNPLRVGLKRFFIEASEGTYDLNTLLCGFKYQYMRNVIALCLKGLYIFLWSLLLVIPGIIAVYRYYFVEYILAENLADTASEALRMSAEMTKGRKFEIFVFDLSFILWNILSSVTFGIAGLYVMPYKEAATAVMYAKVKYDVDM